MAGVHTAQKTDGCVTIERDGHRYVGVWRVEGRTMKMTTLEMGSFLTHVDGYETCLDQLGTLVVTELINRRSRFN